MSCAVYAQLLCSYRECRWRRREQNRPHCKDQCLSWRRAYVTFIFQLSLPHSIHIFTRFMTLTKTQFLYRYDYLFEVDESEEIKVPCLCRAQNCRKFMNWLNHSCNASHRTGGWFMLNSLRFYSLVTPLDCISAGYIFRRANFVNVQDFTLS